MDKTMISVMKQALEALENIYYDNVVESTKAEAAINNLRQAIEQLEREEPPCKTGTSCTGDCKQCAVEEPVAWIHQTMKEDLSYKTLEWKEDTLGYAGEWKKIPLYTHPHKEWQGLTDEERKEIMRYQKDYWGVSGWEWKTCEAIEAKLKEKNT